MAVKIINEKPIREIKEEKEAKKLEIQADAFEVIAMLYEDMEKLSTETANLKTRVEALEGGDK